MTKYTQYSENKKSKKKNKSTKLCVCFETDISNRKNENKLVKKF